MEPFANGEGPTGTSTPGNDARAPGALPLDGRTRRPVAVVTGASSGIGLHTASGLAAAGFDVVLAVRDPTRALTAWARTAGGERPTTVRLDLADLASVANAADELADHHPVIDVVVANAGVMAIPWTPTVDGFETQLGTNHLGHFALVGRLWPRLKAGEAGTVVTVSSLAASSGAIAFDDLQWERTYEPWAAYSRSKLANLLFTRELDRRARAAGTAVRSIAVHPGYAATRLWENGPGPWISRRRRLNYRLGALLFAQSARAGARPALRAVTDATIAGGVYLAPRGPLHLRGAPTGIRFPRAARDDGVARRLWAVSEELTGVPFEP